MLVVYPIHLRSFFLEKSWIFNHHFSHIIRRVSSKVIHELVHGSVSVSFPWCTSLFLDSQRWTPNIPWMPSYWIFQKSRSIYSHLFIPFVSILFPMSNSTNFVYRIYWSTLKKWFLHILNYLSFYIFEFQEESSFEEIAVYGYFLHSKSQLPKNRSTFFHRRHRNTFILLFDR